jgi:hypothetical protein
VFRLSENRGSSSSLYCGPEGLYLGSVVLIARRAGIYSLRHENELTALLGAAYSPSPDIRKLILRLRAIADWLQRQELAQAKVGAVLLRLDDLSEMVVARLIRIDELLKNNFNPDEARDSHGRWTADGAGDTASPAVDGGISAPRQSSCGDASEQSARLQVSARTVSGVA